MVSTRSQNRKRETESSQNENPKKKVSQGQKEQEGHSNEEERVASQVDEAGMEYLDEDDTIIPYVPSLFIVHSWRVHPNDQKVRFNRRQALVSSVLEAEELVKRYRLELADAYNIDLNCSPHDEDSRYFDTRFQYNTVAVNQYIDMDGKVTDIKEEKKEKKDEDEQAEEEFEMEEVEEKGKGKRIEDETKTFYSFLLCLKTLNISVARDNLKMIKNMVHTSKSVVLGWWHRSFPTKIYILRIFTLVPTYDFTPIDRIHLVVAENDQIALRISKRIFVQEVDNRWRRGFTTEVKSSIDHLIRQKRGSAKVDKSNQNLFPGEWNEDTCDKFTKVPLKIIWDCCDDNMSPQSSSPIEMELIKYSHRGNGKWKQEGDTIKIPSKGGSRSSSKWSMKGWKDLRYR